jgi:hypothetical protein
MSLANDQSLGPRMREPANIQSHSFKNILRHNLDHVDTKIFPCPFPNHDGRVFQGISQLYDHVKIEHPTYTGDQEQLRDDAINLRYDYAIWLSICIG